MQAQFPSAADACQARTGIQRRVQKLEARGVKYVLHEGNVFTQSNGVIGALAPASQEVQLGPENCNMLLGVLGGNLVRWTGGFRTDNQPGEWYSVICRRALALDEFPKKKRYTLRKSLEQCSVRRMSAEELADAGYDVYVRTLKSHGVPASSILPQPGFHQSIAREKDFPDLVHNWGVFHEGKLIAYAQNQVYGTDEVNYSAMKLAPDFLKFSPGYALIHTMNHFYLGECGFAYVNDGFRSVSHDTNIQSFLMDTFGFEKAYTTLHLHYRAPLRALVTAAYPFRGIVGKLSHRFGAMLEYERYRRLSASAAR